MNTTTPLYPLLLQPKLFLKVWGGRQLATVLDIPLPDEQPYGEAWGLHDSATILNGAHAGRTLGELVQPYGAALIGAGNNPTEGFPLLAKFIDSQDWLSVQVHPNDEQAARLEGDPRGKTEAWVVVAAQPDSTLISGLKPNTSHEQMAAAIQAGTLEELVTYEHVQAGDAMLVRAGTVHALGVGLLIYEIQQSSDMTYRLYDWGRMGLDGKPRPLHIEKGVAVSKLDQRLRIDHPPTNGHTATLVECEYFKALRYTLRGESLTIDNGGRFHGLTCISGSAEVIAGGERVAFGKGQTVLVPAALAGYTLRGDAVIFNGFQA